MIYVIAIGTFQAFTASLLLLTNKLRSKADGLLILLLFCIAAHLATKFYIFNFVSDGHVRYQMNTFIGFCYAPLLYLYALKIKNEAFIPATRWYVFLPFILGAVGYLTVICVLSFSQQAGYAALNIYNNATTWTSVTFSAYYTLLAWRIARKHLQNRPQERRLIEWVSYLFITIQLVAFFFLNLSYFIKTGVGEMILCRALVYTCLLIVSVIIIRYKYAGFQTPAIIPVVPSPRKTALSATNHQEILLKLDQYLRQTRLYTDADLNLDKLAASVGISKYHISEALNACAEKSFYQFINEWRISHAIEKLQFMTSRNLPVNVLTIAFDCGFKAKSSFNQYFKKITGQTPTEYMRNLAGVS
ncbi:helix-turn-helix domain-containing protein [Chitinophaga sp.]|uniref:helix-turn-helix domain-containing protein n=1 Tax=Chitinophaga sp. TaxID=1869181 RepID=UPI0031DAE4F8